MAERSPLESPHCETCLAEEVNHASWGADGTLHLPARSTRIPDVHRNRNSRFLHDEA